VSGYAGNTRRRGGRRLTRIVVALLVLVGLLVGADFLARSIAEAKLAAEIQSHGFPKKPDVTIEGFPFLTQAARRDLTQVRISSADVPEGPLTITNVNAVLNGVHIDSSLNGATVDQLTGTVLISFPDLARTLTQQVGPLGSLLGGAGLTLSDAGPDEAKASLDLLVTTGSATWRVTQLSGNELNIRLISSSNVPSSLLSSISNINVQIPKLPLGMTIQSVRITPEGVNGTISGHDLSFSS
jgi:hypothetical protein